MDKVYVVTRNGDEFTETCGVYTDKKTAEKECFYQFEDEVEEYNLDEWVTTVHAAPAMVYIYGYEVIEYDGEVAILNYSHYPAYDGMTDFVSIKDSYGAIRINMRKVYPITGDYEEDSKIFEDYENRMRHYTDVYRGYLESGMGYNLCVKKLREEIDKDIGVVKEV